MRHRPTGPSPTARRAAEARPSRRPRRGARWARGIGVAGLVTGFVLAAPVISGDVTPSADEAAGEDLVVMGLDGAPTSATFASAAAFLAMDADGTVRVESTASRGERSALPSPAPTPSPAPVPVEVPPAPVPTTPVPEAAVTVAEAPEAATPERPTAPPVRPEPAGSAAPSPAAPAPPPVAAVPTGSDRAGQVLALVNQERAAAGCRPLEADSRLAAVAAAHSADMRDRGFFDHVNLDGLSPFDRAEEAGVSARAENIARGQADAAAVMDAWMGSPGHRSNILDCGLTRLGVGVADGGGGPWWTQLFA